MRAGTERSCKHGSSCLKDISLLKHKGLKNEWERHVDFYQNILHECPGALAKSVQRMQGRGCAFSLMFSVLIPKPFAVPGNQELEKLAAGAPSQAMPSGGGLTWHLWLSNSFTRLGEVVVLPILGSREKRENARHGVSLQIKLLQILPEGCSSQSQTQSWTPNTSIQFETVL